MVLFAEVNETPVENAKKSGERMATRPEERPQG
jgi:hypothetical protein